jgi:peptidoglycan/xylan/chitin deacetylase (PgdA/CDA1 family)
VKQRIFALLLSWMALAASAAVAEPVPHEIYPIEGTAASVTGARWAGMKAWREGAVALAERYRGDVAINMDPAENAVYLTFDDGPDPVNTVRVINTLKEYGVPATFFFTGENIRRFPAVVRQAHEAGFAIGLHGFSHANMQGLTAAEIMDELNQTNDLLERAIGVRSSIMRPPYGAVGPEEIELIRGMGLTVYLWSLDTLDWAQSNPGEIFRNVEEVLRPGDIILMHAFSGQSQSAEALPQIIALLLDKGYTIGALPG